MNPEFDLSADILYLNHAGVAPWPRRTVAAVTRFAQANAARGAADYAQWLAVETRLRERLADLIGAPSPADIALVKNTSEGLSLIAAGLPWRSGENVVGILQEFPSNRIPWEALGSRGVEYRRLDLYGSSGSDDSRRGPLAGPSGYPPGRGMYPVPNASDGANAPSGQGEQGREPIDWQGGDEERLGRDSPEDALMGLCDERTRLMAVSSVQYARGLRLDLERLGTFCRGRGILLAVDGIQGLGAIPFDLARVRADFVVADGHKWMLGPEGVALFYVNPEVRPRLALHQYGWHMLDHPGNYERMDWSPAADATRFECGSPNRLGIHALEASLSLLQDVGVDAVQAAIAERIGHLIRLVDRRGFELLSPRAPERRAGILTFRVPGVDPATLYKDLTGRGLMCAQRGGGIRFSPHFYTSEEVLERAIGMTAEVAISRAASMVPFG